MSVGLDGTKAVTPIGTVRAISRLEAPGLHKVLEMPGYEGIGQGWLPDQKHAPRPRPVGGHGGENIQSVSMSSQGRRNGIAEGEDPL